MSINQDDFKSLREGMTMHQLFNSDSDFTYYPKKSWWKRFLSWWACKGNHDYDVQPLSYRTFYLKNAMTSVSTPNLEGHYYWNAKYVPIDKDFLKYATEKGESK